ncbi:hypothetical protein WMY93_023041 [Mugilogobius chulae]|uniref:Mixed lineage kinase domain-containing protein n=1 Tax=Mugilogobius chulae TaxID=88201 RepID=A0AAW0N842_9GOBI
MTDILIDQIIPLATSVITMAQNMKANKERCQRVAKRVMSLQDLVLKLKGREPRQISDLVRNSLNELSTTLVCARNIMLKYQQSSKVKSFIFNSSNEDKFLKINERLDDAFQVLSGALAIEQGDKLDQVLSAVAGKNTEVTQPRQPVPIGFSNMCAPSYLPPTTSAIQSPTFPTLNPVRPKIVPAITVTNAPNPPYPPAQRPAYNSNTLSVPTIQANVPCSMPPRVITIPGPPPAPVGPIITWGCFWDFTPQPNSVKVAERREDMEEEGWKKEGRRKGRNR